MEGSSSSTVSSEGGLARIEMQSGVINPAFGAVTACV